MSDDEPVGVIRIGRPPALPPQRPPMQPKRPSHRRYALLAGLGVLVLAVGAATAGILVARHDNAHPATSPTAGPPQLSEAATCLQLLPLLADGAAQTKDVYEHPDRPVGDIAATAESLRILEPSAPKTWQADIATQYTDLQALADAHGDHGRIAAVAERGDAWLASALRLTEGCRPYARS